MKKLLFLLLLGLLACPSYAVVARGWGDSGVVINNSLGATRQEYPNVIAGSAGNTIVGWLDKRSGAYAIYAQKYDTNGTAQWSPTTGITICAASNMIPDALALSANTVYVHMIPDGSGGAIIGWVDYRADGSTGDIYAQRINSSGAVQWTANGVAVCNAANDQSSLTLAADGGTGALFVWVDGRDGGGAYDLYTQSLNSSGTALWTANGLRIEATTYQPFHPNVTDDGANGAIVTWDDGRNGVAYETWAQKVTSAGTVSWTTNGVSICATGVENSNNPKLVADGLGGAIITWWDRRQNPGTGKNDVYAQRVKSDGTMKWTTNGVTICAQSDYTDYEAALAIVTDGSNGAIISWPDYRGATNYGVYAQRVTVDGTPEWTADGVAVNTTANNTTNTLPRMIADGAGGCIIATANYEGVGSTQDIRVHRLDSTGATPVGWSGGKAVGAETTKDQIDPRIASDSSSGVVVVWTETKNDTLGDIWGQALSSSAAYGWSTTTGKELVAATGLAVQRRPAVVGDGAGGAVVVWEDLRAGIADTYDIYAQRFNSSGAVLWTTSGVTLASTAAGGTNNLHPSICRTSDGYFIVAWAAGNDIYVQKLNTDGAVQWTAGGVNIMTGQACGNPVVASDGAGGAVAAYYLYIAMGVKGAKPGDRLWASAYLSDLSDEELPDLDGTLWAAGVNVTKYRIYYKRIDSSGAIVTPYGGAVQAMNSTGVLATTYDDDTNGEIQFWPAIAKLDSTNVGIVWDDYRTVSGVTSWSIYAQKVLISDGSRQWTDDAKVVTAPGGTVATYYPWIGSNGTDGGAVVTWIQSATSGAGYNYNVLANKLSSAGALSWSTGINVANDGTLDEIWPRVAVDSAGSSYLVWQEGTWASADTLNAATQHPDSPTMSNGKIYLQLVDSTGALSGSKFQISTDSTNFERPDVTCDTAGTALVVWDVDIYAQKITGLLISASAPTGFSGAAQSSSSILWSWTDNANNETGFKLIDANNTVKATIATANTASYAEGSLSPNTAYQRTVATYNDAGSSASPALATVYTLASVPTGLAATVAETSLSITWSGDGTTYKVERAASSSGSWTTLSSTVTSKTYNDTGLTANTTYWYRVTAANGDSVWSAASDAGSFTTGTAATKLSPQIGGTKYANTNLAITSSDHIPSTGDLKLNVSDLNTDGRITSVVVEFLNSAGTVVRKIESSEVLSSYTLSDPLPAGTYTVRITATSVYGTTTVKELTGMVVADKLEVTKALVAYPTILSRSSIRAQGVSATQVAYQLSKNGSVSMVIYGVDGQIVYRGDYAAGQNGGSAGPNAVSWDGYTVAGAQVGRGLYIVQLIDRDSKQLLGKVAIPVQ